MPAQEYSPRRSRTSRKPWPECPDIVIYRCAKCGMLLQNLGYGEPPEPPVCCGEAAERLKPFQPGANPELEARYRIVGGLNNSAVEVFWSGEARPEWIMLKTFTGSYIRYLTEKKRPPMVFPLADEDAYVYCDRPVCEQCVFRCKRGFVIYIYYKEYGLLEMPMDEMSGYFTTRS